MSIHTMDVIQEPWITEKAAKQASQNKYFFKVNPHATKSQIKKAVEEIFNVKVVDVNTIHGFGKWKRVRIQPGKTNDYKKAIVTLKEGQKIELA